MDWVSKGFSLGSGRRRDERGEWKEDSRDPLTQTTSTTPSTSCATCVKDLYPSLDPSPASILFLPPFFFTTRFSIFFRIPAFNVVSRYAMSWVSFGLPRVRGRWRGWGSGFE